MYKSNIMKNLLLSLFILASVGFISITPAASQNTTIECMYEYSYIVDTTAVKMSADGMVTDGDTTKVKKIYMLLRCGGNISQYYSYDRMVMDSVVAANKMAGKQERYKGKTGLACRIYKDFGNSKLTVVDKVGMDWFKVVEAIPDFKWNICDDWKEISGYKVRKATCDFRGRRYEAWFAPDIPVSDGPWKFCGLPGLVFQVYDQLCQYHYCLTGIKLKNAAVDYVDENMMEVNMKKLNNTKRRYLENPAMYMSSTYAGPVSFVDKDGKPIDPETLNKVLKYDFQEIKF